MSALDDYIQQLIDGEEDTLDFPKNESSWEELFEFGKRRIVEIVTLKKEIAYKDAVIETMREANLTKEGDDYVQTTVDTTDYSADWDAFNRDFWSDPRDDGTGSYVPE